MTDRISQKSIFLFWAPLAATWLMMAVEGPYLAAVIARLPDPKFNLAAHGVAFAFAVLVEAPVIMLMSAATALVEDAVSYRRLRAFMALLGVLTTAALLVVLVPALYRFVMITLVGLPAEVADLTHGALWIYLPWPAAIGYRRFLQGVLIRSGRTRLVAYGTVIRLIAMSSMALVGALALDLPGASVGALALSTGVVVEALAARWMVGPTLRELFAAPPRPPEEGPELHHRDIVSFYVPLALTSLIGLTVHPLLTFFMGRSRAPIESLAVFPVVQSLSFIFRSLGLSFQDTAIALMGERHRHLPELKRFTLTLGLAASAGISLVAFTPLADVWFEGVSGLTPDLAVFAYVPARVIFALPALTVLLGLQRAILVNVRRTRGITVATTIEVVLIAATFVVAGWGFDLVGVTAAFTAFIVGRVAANTFLAMKGASVIRQAEAPGVT
ncbi:MAG TPA: hypothetical protein VK849_01875 [Longimicrobiales bacterium]|nr:hypothetical protein [Longimicrobiales bacterium]